MVGDDRIHRQVTNWPAILVQCHAPLVAMFRIAPASLERSNDLVSHRAKSRSCGLDLADLEWVAPSRQQAARFSGEFTSLCKRDRTRATQPHLSELSSPGFAPVPPAKKKYSPSP